MEVIDSASRDAAGIRVAEACAASYPRELILSAFGFATNLASFFKVGATQIASHAITCEAKKISFSNLCTCLIESQLGIPVET